MKVRWKPEPGRPGPNLKLKEGEELDDDGLFARAVTAGAADVEVNAGAEGLKENFSPGGAGGRMEGV